MRPKDVAILVALWWLSAYGVETVLHYGGSVSPPTPVEGTPQIRGYGDCNCH